MRTVFLAVLFLGVFASVGVFAEAKSTSPQKSKSAKPKPPPQNALAKTKAAKPAKARVAKVKPAETPLPPKPKPAELCIENIEFSSVNHFLEAFEVRQDAFDNLPVEVKCFVANAVACEHFAGEEPYDKDREAFVYEALKQYCSAARNQLRPLEKKYANREEVLRVLAICEKDAQTVCAD